MSLAEIDEAAFNSELITDWYARVLHECDVMVIKYKNRPSKTLPMIIRHTLWRITSGAKLNVDAIPSLACRILEEFFHNHFIRMHEELMADEPPFSEYENRLSQKTMLYIAAALLISAKYKFNGTFINQILSTTTELMSPAFTASDLKKAEREVLIGIKFEIPIWGTLDVSLILAVKIGRLEQEKGRLPLITSVAELYRALIDDSVENQTKGSIKSPNGTNVINCLTDLHLAAGCVSFCLMLRQLESSPENYIPRLASLTFAPVDYIKLIANHISDYMNAARESELLKDLFAETNL